MNTEEAIKQLQNILDLAERNDEVGIDAFHEEAIKMAIDSLISIKMATDGTLILNVSSDVYSSTGRIMLCEDGSNRGALFYKD